MLEPRLTSPAGARLLLCLLFGLGACSAPLPPAARAQLAPATTEVRSIALTVADLDEAERFFTQALGFEREGERHVALSRSLGVAHSTRLRAGEEHIELVQYAAGSGRSAPADSRSNDTWFQHLALVTRDSDALEQQVLRAGASAISRGTQTIPESNPTAGGIRAFYFRGPSAHPLELIDYPPGKGQPRWQRGAAPVLGIDHTAIVVSSTDRSLAFYRDALGLRVAGGAENWGVEQEHLNQVFGARLRITALRAERGPGIEFLEYITPPGGRGLPADAKVNDLLAWRVRLKGAGTDSQAIPGSLIGKTGTAVLVHDPDGHLLEIHP